MGLFYTAPRKPLSSAPLSSHHIDQHGSAHGEINMHEYKAGIHREIDHAFSGHEREAIKSLVEQQFDSSSTNRRHILDGHEAEAIIKDVHGIYSKEHADKLRTILDRRLQ